MPIRYAELSPSKLKETWKSNPTAIVPIGALEWHGEHLPLGTDGLIAERFAEELSDRLQAVLLPTAWLPMTTLPHPHSLQIRSEAFRMWVEDLLAGLYRAGARKVALVTGHYAQGHEVQLYEAALSAMEDHPGLLVLAAAPLELLGDDDLLDHAGRWETAQMLLIRPELVWLEALPESPNPEDHAVLGQDPRLATAESAERVWDAALSAWQEQLSLAAFEGLRAWYGRAFDRYQPYMDRYFQGSWEDAILTWWQEKLASQVTPPRTSE